ncbi:MAG: metal-dependent amidase/aminoacylase/carboxypeptidase family protein [Candidatus Azotimanducaceae bacterium]|jgi:metal-dependent amidase/aminoacylase/carboxypeptidase family protein
MIDDGLLLQFPFDRIFSLHNMPGEPAASISTRIGPIMAAATTWDLIIQGKGAHAGWPHLGIDSISVAAAFVEGCNAIIARMVDPLSGATISPTQISGGNSYNTLPEDVRIGGTLRTLDDAATEFIIARMRNSLQGLPGAKDAK